MARGDKYVREAARNINNARTMVHEPQNNIGCFFAGQYLGEMRPLLVKLAKLNYEAKWQQACDLQHRILKRILYAKADELT